MRKVLLTLSCLALLAPMFLVAVTSSAPYDAWSDLDDDGDIDIFDLVKIAGAYGTLGDPSKNVTIVGHANKLAYSTQQTVGAESSFSTPWITVDGYSKVSICIFNTATTNIYDLRARHFGGTIYFFADIELDVGGEFGKTYDVPNQEVQVYFMNNDLGPRFLAIDIYLIA